MGKVEERGRGERRLRCEKKPSAPRKAPGCLKASSRGKVRAKEKKEQPKGKKDQKEEPEKKKNDPVDPHTRERAETAAQGEPSQNYLYTVKGGHVEKEKVPKEENGGKKSDGKNRHPL